MLQRLIGLLRCTVPIGIRPNRQLPERHAILIIGAQAEVLLEVNRATFITAAIYYGADLPLSLT